MGAGESGTFTIVIEQGSKQEIENVKRDGDKMPAKSTNKTRTAPATKQFASGQKPKSVPTRDEIARRAYEIYVARGQTGGKEMDDWLEAERELLGKGHRNN